MVVIKVPKTPRKAFDPNRPPSDLLVKQIEHLEWAARPASERSPRKFRVKKPKTEREAAERIASLTEKVFAEARARRGGTAPLPGATDLIAPPGPRAASKARVRRTTKKKTRRRKRTAR